MKIVLKGDNLGIGCKGGVRDDECTGLDSFQDLLGRLNGEEEEVEKRVQRRKVELVSGRYGMKFVRGETYVSSDISKLLENIGKMEEAETAREKKREERRRKKNERKAAKSSKAEQEDEVEESPASPLAEELANKEEKRKKKEKKPKKSGSSTPALTSSSDSEAKPKKRKRGDDAKKSKKSKKDKRDKKEKGDERGRSKESSDIETPALISGTVTPTALTGRHAIRHRYIAAKRNAVMDTKALNEVCFEIFCLSVYQAVCVGHANVCCRS